MRLRTRRPAGTNEVRMTKWTALRALTITLALMLFSVGLMGGWMSIETRWPGLHQDSSRYSTVIINRANGLGNT
ncbi:MAG: hypothetical protein EBZ36_00560, partial [Acidobacteria bacterium]|nr:hypothetical protein [Acidobacteriota bacterium]